MPNPISDQGLLLTPREYDVVSKVIAAFAEQSKTSEPAISKLLIRVLGRMGQAQQAPNGLRDDQLKHYESVIHEAFASHDERALTIAVQNLIAATVRTDADPAQKVAQYLLQLIAVLLTAQAKHGAATLRRLLTLLDDAMHAWEGDGWPDAKGVAAWIRDVVAVGADNLGDGDDPWPQE